MYRLNRCVPLAHEDRLFKTRITPRSRPAFSLSRKRSHWARASADAEFIGREIDRLEKIGSDFLRFSIPQLRVPP